MGGAEEGKEEQRKVGGEGRAREDGREVGRRSKAGAKRVGYEERRRSNECSLVYAA